MVRFDQFVLGVAAFAMLAAFGCSQNPEPLSTGSSGMLPHVGATAIERARLREPTLNASLRDLATKVSTRAGVSAPKTMHVVAASDHQEAESVVSGAIIGDHDPVYVIQMTGGPFTASSHPSGGEAPRGDILTVTVSAATLEITDVGYDSVAPDLTKIDSEVVDFMAP